MYKKLRYILCFVLFIGFFSNASAQLTKLEIQSVDISQFPVNYVYYTAKNLLGKDAGILGEFDIKVYEDGVEQRLWIEEEERVPASLVLILDSSGSMKHTMTS